MSVAPHAGIIDFGTFTPPTLTLDGIQGEVPQPLIGQENYVLTGNGWSSLADIGGLTYQGTWNASTNTPTLTSSVGTQGYYYVVSVAGSTNLNGITSWAVGDWAVFNGSVWQRIQASSTFGTMAYQNANAVAITGGSVNNTSQSKTTISDYETFTGVSAPSYAEGELWYDSASHALAYYNDSSTSTVHIGQDIQVKVINNTGSTIANGSPVYITSTSSGQT